MCQPGIKAAHAARADQTGIELFSPQTGAAIYFLDPQATGTAQTLGLGHGEKPQMQHIEDLRTSELLAAGILVAGIMLFGLFPAPLIDLSAATVTQMNSLIGQRLL